VRFVDGHRLAKQTIEDGGVGQKLSRLLFLEGEAQPSPLYDELHQLLSHFRCQRSNEKLLAAVTALLGIVLAYRHHKFKHLQHLLIVTYYRLLYVLHTQSRPVQRKTSLVDSQVVSLVLFERQFSNGAVVVAQVEQQSVDGLIVLKLETQQLQIGINFHL
jgi:hypothetical protein